ncbi:MAG: carboxymuconolactone decarboxylase family protein [Acidimicrobiales bacterium]
MQQGLEDDLYHLVEEYKEIGAFSEAEKLAAETAERFNWDHEAMLGDEDYWARMKEHFTDQQILELLTLIGFCVGIGRTLAVLEIADDCPINQTADPVEDPAHFVHG